MDSDYSRASDDGQHPIIQPCVTCRNTRLRFAQKIVEDGARRVRAEGLTGTAVSAVMRDAGLTHGGFYKHFDTEK